MSTAVDSAAGLQSRVPERASPTVLVLFTDTFPFGRSETFLETEIEYLARAFRKVLVVPGRIGGDLRPIPSNVEVDRSLAEVHRSRMRAASLLTALRSREFFRELRSRPKSLLESAALRRLIGYSAATVRTRRWLQDLLGSGRVAASDALFYTYWLATEAAALAAERRLRPELHTVSRAHGIDLYWERHEPPYIPLQRHALKGMGRVCAVSENGRAYLADRHPGLAERIGVARLGVNDPGFITRGSTDGVFRVVSCSNLYPVKRVDLLVEGIAVLARQHPDLTIEWNHLGDGYLRPQIEEDAGHLLPANVRWSIHGKIPNRDVLAFYRENPVDAFVNVSSSEGVPVSIMEAQSCGIPVVATAVGGTPEIVNECSGVLLKPSPAPREVAGGLTRLLPGSPGGSALRAGSRRAWGEHSDAAKNYPGFVQRLYDVAGRSG